MISQFTHKHTTFTKMLLVIALGLIILWQSVSLSRDPMSDLSQVSARDIRLANSRPWQAPSPWSPDGQWVVWSSVSDGLYIQKADSNAERKQLGSPGISRDAIIWALDGKELFYQVNQPIEEPPFTQHWIESVDIETGKVTEHPEWSTYDDLDGVLTPRSHSLPLWSPDGQWVVWSSVSDGLYIQKADSSTERKQLGNPGVPRREIAWSWDSKKLFYQVNQPIEEPPFTQRWIESVDIETGTVTEHPELSIYDNLDSVASARSPSDPILSFNFKDNIIEARTKNGAHNWSVTPDPVRYLSTTLSPDKKKVLVYRSIYATDGSGLSIDLGKKSVGKASFGSWSPDSTKIIYTIEEDDGHTITASDIYVINADGTDEKQLTYTPDKLESDPRWSADGTKIVFHSILLNFDRAPVHVADNVVYVADIVVVTE